MIDSINCLIFCFIALASTCIASCAYYVIMTTSLIKSQIKDINNIIESQNKTLKRFRHIALNGSGTNLNDTVPSKNSKPKILH